MKTVLLRTTMSAESIDLESITSLLSLFDVQLSNRSGLVREVQAAEELLHQYELLTTINFACIKQNQGFGSTDMVFQKLYVNLQEEGGK